MRIGVSITLMTPFCAASDMIEIAQLAEQMGFSTIWRGEHVLTFPRYTSKYPYTSVSGDEGKSEWLNRPDAGIPESFMTLTYLAAQTRRIRLGTGICIVPQRNPVYTASMVATIDFFSGGRFNFGVGLGWSSEEYEALGTPWAGRGKRMNEYLQLMRKLWSEHQTEFHGETYDLPPALQYPKPVQKPWPPIYVGGESDAALERVAELGDAWYGMGVDADQVPERRAKLRELCERRGRNPDEIQIAIAPYFRSVGMDEARRYAEAGVDELIIMMGAPTLQDHIKLMEQHAALIALDSGGTAN